MRTYTRKRLKHEEIEGVKELCRLCLEKPEDSIPLFPEETDSTCTALVLRIMMCVGLEMSKNEALPDIICLQCHNELEKFYTFRKKCEVSYQKLKSHIAKLKEKEINDEEQKINNEVERIIAVKKFMDIDKNCENIELNTETNQLTFTINTDGSIQLTEDMDFLNREGPIVKLLKLEEFKPQLYTNSKVKILSEEVISSAVHNTQVPVATSIDDIGCEMKEVALEEYSTVHNNQMQLPQPKSETPEVPTEQELSVSVETQAGVQEWEMTSFLSTMLVELGLLTRHGEDVVTLNSKAKALEIETGDGDEITLELVEEDDDDNMEESSTKILSIQEIGTEENSHGAEQNLAVNNVDKDANTTKQIMKPTKGRAWCPICGKQFSSGSIVTRHVRNVHARQRPHVCSICGKRFAQKNVMIRHRLVHEEKRPFQCPQCPKSYTQRGAMQAHARQHAPARPLAVHQCPHCPKIFLYSSGLSRHMIVHTSKHFVCVTCDRKFKDKSSLHRHMRVMKHDQPQVVSLNQVMTLAE